MTTDLATTLPAAPERLLDRRHLPVVVGIVALVTLAAFENRAVQTVLPVIVRDLDGWALFGASTGASLVTFTVATAWSGGWTDRFGPRPVLLAGLGVFAVAQLVSAVAPTMTLFVAGRALSGAAEALVDTTLLVIVAQALPESLRAKVFATFAAAWILPSLLGPGLAGGIEAVAGWRFVFLGPLVVVPVALVLLRPALRRGRAADAPTEVDPGARGRLVAAVLLAAGLAVTTFCAPLLESPASRAVGLGVVLAGVVVVLAAAARALPAGTARLAHGIPALVAQRLLVAAAFTAVGSVLPLMLVTTHDVSTAVAGVSLSVTGVMWATGSWLNSLDRVAASVSPAARTRIGMLLIGVGSVGPLLLSLDVVPIPVGLVGWGAAATGMGLVSPVLSTELLAQAAEDERGRVSAAQGLASSTGVALATALVGGVVAWFGPAMDGPRYALLVAAGAAVALVGAAGAGRVRPT